MASLASATCHFNNTGDAKAFPVFTIKGPATSVEAISPSGSSWKWTGSLLSGQTLTVDHEKGTIVDQNGANQYAGLSPAPRFWWIPPGQSQGTIKVTGSNPGGLTASAVVHRNVVHNPRGQDESGTVVKIRTNLAENPALRTGNSTGWDVRGFGDNADGTSSVSATLGRTAGFIRKTWTKVATDNDGDRGFHMVGIVPENTDVDDFTASVYVRSSRAMVQHYIELWAYNSSGDRIGKYGRKVVSNIPANTWTRVDTTATLPDSTRSIRVVISVLDERQFAVNDTYDACDALVEAGSTLGDWFDYGITPLAPFTVAQVGKRSEMRSPLPTDWSTAADKGPEPFWVARYRFEDNSIGIRAFIPSDSSARDYRQVRFALPRFVGQQEFTPGQKVSYVFQARSSHANTVPVNVMQTDGTGKLHTSPVGMAFTTDWTQIRGQATVAAEPGDDAVVILSLPVSEPDKVDHFWDFKIVSVVPGDFQEDAFDGDVPDDASGTLYDWTGVAHESISTKGGTIMSGRTEVTVSWRPRRWLVI